MACPSDRDARVALVAQLVFTLVMMAVALTRAQTATVTTTADLPAGTSYVAVRAFDTAGAQSGYSNVVQVSCGTAPCTRSFLWDANTEPTLAGYILVWGAASGVYTNSKTIPAGGTTPPGKLPTPPLRIRRSE